MSINSVNNKSLRNIYIYMHASFKYSKRITKNINKKKKIIVVLLLLYVSSRTTSAHPSMIK